MGYTGQRPSAIPLTTADIIDGTITNDDLAGSITSAKITSLDATKLTGTVADARLPDPLPAISGASLTNLPSEITKQSSDPTVSSPATPTLGDVIVNTTSGEMFTCTTVSSGANVWTNIGDGTGDIAPFTGMVGTGGTITTDGDYKVHTFNSSGTFTVTTLGSLGTVEYLVTAGGASGARANGGGGGAGGYRTATGFSVSATSYSITVGAGGASSGLSVKGNNGADSIFSSITSTGGGGGGTGYATSDDGKDGGSGGGGSETSGGRSGTGGSGNTPSTSPSQGNNGGNGAAAPNYPGGGGGGAR